jgi:hypothetical protein
MCSTDDYLRITMTNTLDNSEDPMLEEGRKLVAENKALHVVHKASLVGGPADGQSFSLPDGVETLQVEVEGAGILTYVRDTENTFIPETVE